MSKAITALLALALIQVALPARASFHLWRFREVFSNASGTVQFIEMLDGFDGENLVGGKQLKSTANTFTLPANLPSNVTANHRLLFATAGFGALPGGVSPDYIIPANFFNPAGDTLNFANVDIQTFGAIPTDGITSRDLPGTGTSINSPTNFANASGSVNLAVPEPTFVSQLVMVFSAAVLRRRRGY